MFYVEHMHQCVYNYWTMDTPCIDTLTETMFLYTIHTGAIIRIAHRYFRKKQGVDIPFSGTEA